MPAEVQLLHFLENDFWHRDLVLAIRPRGRKFVFCVCKRSLCSLQLEHSLRELGSGVFQSYACETLLKPAPADCSMLIIQLCEQPAIVFLYLLYQVHQLLIAFLDAPHELELNVQARSMTVVALLAQVEIILSGNLMFSSTNLAGRRRACRAVRVTVVRLWLQWSRLWLLWRRPPHSSSRQSPHFESQRMERVGLCRRQ